MKPDIEIQIEELVLLGFPHGSRYRIGKAIEDALTAVLSTKGVPDSLKQSAEIQQVDGGTFHLPRDVKPEAIGNDIANSVYKGLAK